MSAFCQACHGDFHKQNTQSNGSGVWIRHPSDRVIPVEGEFEFAFGSIGGGATGIYDPLIPVARAKTGAQAGSMTVSGTVTPGSDMVMCLSCHRAHASPYYKMLRWDIQSGDLATALYGCGQCHSSKN